MPLKKSKPKHKSSEIKIKFEAIGTWWVIELQDFKAVKASDIEALIRERIDTFDRNYSRFRVDSLVTKMARKAGTYTLPDDARPMMDMYRQLYEISGGLMTPLIGNMLADAGYDAAYSLQPKKLSDIDAWDDCLEYKHPKLLVKKPVLLDFGGLGKGYLVDIIGQLLKDAGCTEFVINAGGDILHAGKQVVEIALEDAVDSSQAIGVATIGAGALCGSAGNRRAWGQYNHILNPHTKSSPRHITAAWVHANTALLADALTTALYFITPGRLANVYTFNYAIVQEDSSLIYSDKFPAIFFEEGEG